MHFFLFFFIKRCVDPENLMDPSNLPPLPSSVPPKSQTTTTKPNQNKSKLDKTTSSSIHIKYTPTTSPDKTTLGKTYKDNVTASRISGVAIVFIIIASVIFVLTIFGLIYWCCCKNHTSKDSQGNLCITLLLNMTLQC